MFSYELCSKMLWVLATQTTLNSGFLAVFWSLKIADLNCKISPIFLVTITLKKHISPQSSPQFFPEIELEPQVSAG